jgi:hypothetical protein
MKLQCLALGVLLFAMAPETRPGMRFATVTERRGTGAVFCVVSLVGGCLSLKAVYSQNVELRAIAIELLDSGAKISRLDVATFSKIFSIEFPKNISKDERERLERLWDRYKALQQDEGATMVLAGSLILLFCSSLFLMG